MQPHTPRHADRSSGPKTAPRCQGRRCPAIRAPLSRFFGPSLTLSLLLSASGAHAYRGSGAVRFDAHVNLGYADSLGVGARVDIPVATRGLLRTANDELALSPGVTLLFAQDGDIGIWFPVVLQWNFYVDRDWSLFPELGLALAAERNLTVRPTLSMGGRYHFASLTAFLFRVNWPLGLQLGATF